MNFGAPQVTRLQNRRTKFAKLFVVQFQVFILFYLLEKIHQMSNISENNLSKTPLAACCATQKCEKIPP